MGIATETISSQVNALLGGQLVIPSIQRGYVWRRSQVPALLDSLYRGFPVGNLLIWKTSVDVPLRPASVLQGEPSYTRPAVLLDGQQRLTSLAKIFAPEKVVGGTLDVRFDLEYRGFLNPSAVQRRNPMLLSVHELLQESPQYFEILRHAGVDTDHANFDDLYERVKRVHAIRSYLMPIVTIESDDYEEVAEIFSRVNQSGRRLSKGDLVYSAIAARWPDGLETIETFTAELDDRNYKLDREAVLRLTALLADLGAYPIRLINKDVSGGALKEAWASTEEALRLAVDFLISECSIPRAAVLTSPNVVVVPALLLYLRKNMLAEDEVDALRRWVYTAMAFSHYSNQVESKMEVEARLVRSRSGSDLFDDLIRRASGPRSSDSPISPNDLQYKGSSSPFFNLLYIVALRSGARDWCSNALVQSMPMSSSASIEYHHVFPKARVAKSFAKDQVNSLANLAFISGQCNRKIGAKLPEVYLQGVNPDRLSEQWVPCDTTLWKIDEFPRFLAARREAQAAALNDLLGLPHYTGAGDSDRDAEVPEDDDTIDDVEETDIWLFVIERGGLTGTRSSASA